MEPVCRLTESDRTRSALLSLRTIIHTNKHTRTHIKYHVLTVYASNCATNVNGFYFIFDLINNHFNLPHLYQNNNWNIKQLELKKISNCFSLEKWISTNNKNGMQNNCMKTKQNKQLKFKLIWD